MRVRRGSMLVLAIAAAAALVSWPAQSTVQATAVGITVTGTDDPPGAICPNATECPSLRAAIQQANADKLGPHIITLGVGTYSLTLRGVPDDDAEAGDLDILEDIIIQGAGADQTFIDAKKIKERAFHVPLGGSLTLRDLTVQRGNARGPTNEATGAGSGGGVLSFGALTAERVLFTRNKATGDGGGISGEGGTATLRDVTIFRNRSKDDGAGLDFDDGVLLIERATIARNKAKGEGGGLENEALDSTLINVTISGNKAKAAGGGINNEDGGELTLVHTTVAFNKAKAGGGVVNDTQAAPSTLTIRSTLIAKNKKVDCLGTLETDGGNIQGDGTCGEPTTADPLLEPLADNDGDPAFVMQTHALSAGSPAIDFGREDHCTATPTDQRGFERVDDPSVKLRLCDSGAFEFGSTEPPDRPRRSRR